MNVCLCLKLNLVPGPALTQTRQHQSSKPARNSKSVSLFFPPSLYLGPRSEASSKRFLTSNFITDVLGIAAAAQGGGRVRADGVTYHRLSINDSTSSSISKIADAACEIINSAIAKTSESSSSASKKGASGGGGYGKILVHCSASISRSPMVVAAYLMNCNGMTLKSALGQTIRVRPQVLPNAGFFAATAVGEGIVSGCMYDRGHIALDVSAIP